MTDIVVPEWLQRALQDITPEIRLGDEMLIPEEVVFIFVVVLLGSFVSGVARGLLARRAAGQRHS